jgi:hypothetical protein
MVAVDHEKKAYFGKKGAAGILTSLGPLVPKNID